MGKLDGQVAIVTGAARGIGRAYALRLAALGADVVIADLNLSGAAKIGEALTAESVMAEVEALGRRAIGVEGDLRDPAAVDDLFARTDAAFGRLDILVNNAGVAMARGSGHLPSDTTPEAFAYLIDANLKSTMLCSQAAIAPMRQQGGGVIVNISSQTGISVLPDGMLAAYGAAKAGIAHLTRSFAAALGPSGIRVNAIAPGIVQSARMAKIDPATKLGGDSDREAIALRRFGTTEDMAGVLEFLVTDLSAYVTGQVISACGGRVLHAH
jgi:3-oxoacyl-[acyl-carrier protein] reductase